SSSGGVAITVGAALAKNDISNETSAKSNSSSLNTSSGGKVTVEADSGATIYALTIGIAGAISTGSGSGASFAGAGSLSFNGTSSSAAAAIVGGSVSSAGDLKVTASDSSSIPPDAGGVAIVIARGPPAVFAFAVSLAINNVTDMVDALVSLGATVTAPN